MSIALLEGMLPREEDIPTRVRKPPVIEEEDADTAVYQRTNEVDLLLAQLDAEDAGS